MNDTPLAKRLRLLASIVSGLLLLAILAGAWFYFQLRASLPQLDGTHALGGLAAPVTVTRDVLGVPTVRGKNRADVARALGFLHAQDRFFQMDLLRRRAAGELAEIFGKSAVPIDRETRPHRFRALAQKVLAALSPADRALLEGYAAGVNAGLTALARKPFEYLVLRVDPQPWRAEDSLLVCYAMALDLQDADNKYEHSLGVLRDQLGTEAVAFFAPIFTPDDAALDGSTAPLPPIPPPAVLDLRKTAAIVPHPTSATYAAAPDQSGDLKPGSNSFALSGAHTANGAALLANDPHLDLRVPNLWYRAVLEWADPVSIVPTHRVVGVTIPGLPLIVLGSNGRIAWSLTDAYADTSDLVAVDVNPIAHSLYKVPGRDDLLEIEQHRDTLHVKGDKDVVVETSWTLWGRIVGADSKERPLADHWIVEDPAATNLEFMHLETAADVADAVAIAHRAGIPAHNFLVADNTGAIAWTIAGRLPKRVGFDGRLPTSWSFGDRRWDGPVPDAEIPTLIEQPSNPAQNPPKIPAPSGRLWTANNRVVGGAAGALIGDGGYGSPPRAAQIRDALAKIEHAAPRDLLAIQLDDRALFLARWQKLLTAVLTPDAVTKKKSRAEFREIVSHWDGAASVDSVSYRLVREFRSAVATLALEPIFAPGVDAFPGFDWHHFNYEPALWTMIAQKPAHLLDPSFASWNALLLAAVDRVIADLGHRHVPLDRATWGARNTAKIHHPFGDLLPLGLGAWLNLPADPLPGDTHMPRVQSPSFGASMRLVVSPGHENEGLFEMPGGQSGHPLSPFYRAGHEAWVRGEPTPLLPGETRHTLVLTP